MFLDCGIIYSGKDIYLVVYNQDVLVDTVDNNVHVECTEFVQDMVTQDRSSVDRLVCPGYSGRCGRGQQDQASPHHPLGNIHGDSTEGTRDNIGQALETAPYLDRKHHTEPCPELIPRCGKQTGYKDYPGSTR
jgi:hypothetical protein